MVQSSAAFHSSRQFSDEVEHRVCLLGSSSGWEIRRASSVVADHQRASATWELTLCDRRHAHDKAGSGRGAHPAGGEDAMVAGLGMGVTALALGVLLPLLRAWRKPERAAAC